MPYKMETYQQILTILSPTKVDEFIQYRFTGLPAVEIAYRLPSRLRAYVNQCLHELVAKQFLRFEDEYTGETMQISVSINNHNDPFLDR